jgi:murein L,D-transpeptidase YcbB/YkuD
VVARKLGLPGDYFTETHAALVRGLQREHGLTPHGVVDASTAVVLGEAASAGLPPEWWDGDVAPSDPEYSRLSARFGVDEAAVRRLQGTNGLQPTGLIDRSTAGLLDRLA